MPDNDSTRVEFVSIDAASTPGIQAITSEREEQLQKYSPQHDKLHRGELVAAAGAYADWAANTLLGMASEEPNLFWPWYESEWKPGTPKDAIRKAGAMLAAALDVIEDEES